MRRKITVVGAGMVGGTTAQRLADRNYADVVLLDVVEGLPQGKALDTAEAAPLIPFDGRLIGTNSYDDTAGSDIVIITAGVARKAGQSREDLLLTNARIVRDAAEKSYVRSPNALFIIVTNPMDAMAQLVYEVTRLPRHRVIGMGGVLDSARLRAFIAWELKVSVRDVSAFVLGGHGEAMVPMPRYTTVAGIPLSELLSREKIDALVQRAINGGAEIVSLLKAGSAFSAPSASIVEMVDAVVRDEHRILPCSVYLQGEYGIEGYYVGVPVKLGAQGVEEIIQLTLTMDEAASLLGAAKSVREMVATMGF